MKTVSIYEAKTHLSKLVAALEAGEDRVVLCRNGVPVADLVRHDRIEALPEPGDDELAGARFLDDPCAPLSEEDWPSALR